MSGKFTSASAWPQTGTSELIYRGPRTPHPGGRTKNCETRFLQRECDGHTLQSTALVHEVYFGYAARTCRGGRTARIFSPLPRARTWKLLLDQRILLVTRRLLQTPAEGRRDAV